MKFCMELSLPYLTLREVPSTTRNDRNTGKDTNDRSDLSFLSAPGSTIFSNHSRWILREATTSVMICGTSHFQWTGYAFSGGAPVDDEVLGADTEFESDCIEGETPLEDLFVTGGKHRASAEQNTIWDPRVYFLHCVESRVDSACQELTYIVAIIEARTKLWVGGPDIFHSHLN